MWGQGAVKAVFRTGSAKPAIGWIVDAALRAVSTHGVDLRFFTSRVIAGAVCTRIQSWIHAMRGCSPFRRHEP